jgi:hypothetical protein
MDYGLVECCECPTGTLLKREACVELESEGQTVYICHHHKVRYTCDICQRVE